LFSGIYSLNLLIKIYKGKRIQQQTTMTALKGDCVRFVAGKYGGKTGWINLSERADEEIVPVVVNLGRKGEKATYVYRTSVQLDTSETKAPTCYAEAVINQCPDIEKALVEVSRKLAKCDVRRDPDGFQRILEQKLSEAIAYQEGKGSKAMYRRINFHK
jgi:hypothetical protein